MAFIHDNLDENMLQMDVNNTFLIDYGKIVYFNTLQHIEHNGKKLVYDDNDGRLSTDGHFVHEESESITKEWRS
ncbi:MAG: hypothetical protein EZS28_000430 [Streblomastix strix]|uniref:Uncharacterized protein n=1 Tax=Streblomastix strix TaxID=222440 RepID=A0A5J4XA86_9EUKA|nr:MAG: hypothetical protein EZS28_000430 [Streblomastix strix]